MKKILPLVLIVFLYVIFSFKSEDKGKGKTYWYKAANYQGYISLEKVKNTNGTVTLKTRVNTYFGKEKLDFNLSTTCDTDKMLNASKFIFDGTIDSNMNTVVFVGERVKSKKNVAFWSFNGDYKNELSIDHEVRPFINSKHTSLIRVPARTIPSFNIWAIVPNLDFDRKGTFEFNSLDETKLHVRKNQTINYLGKFDESIDGKKTQLHKFVHQGKGMKPAYYWVNNNRELVKILLDGKFTFTLSKKDAIVFENIAEDND